MKASMLYLLYWLVRLFGKQNELQPKVWFLETKRYILRSYDNGDWMTPRPKSLRIDDKALPMFMRSKSYSWK